MVRLTPRAIRACVIGLIAVPVMAGLGVAADAFIEDDNFRVVTPDLYRAGQLRPDEWSESFDAYGYRSVLNLRGASPAQPWYQVERAFAASHGLAHFDLQMSAEAEPSPDSVEQLIAIMSAAPKPLLIHCKEGADRSGLAAALYLVAVEGRPASEAAGQLSLWSGIFPGWPVEPQPWIAPWRPSWSPCRCAPDPGAPEVR